MESPTANHQRCSDVIPSMETTENGCAELQSLSQLPIILVPDDNYATETERSSNVIQMMETTENDCVELQSPISQLPLILVSERGNVHGTELNLEDAEFIVKSEPLETEYEDNGPYSMFQTDQTAASGYTPITVDDFQIKEECEPEGEQSGASIKLGQKSWNINSQSESPDASYEIKKFVVATSKGTTLKDNSMHASWKSFRDKREYGTIFGKSCEGNLIQVDQGMLCQCQPSTSQSSLIKEEPNFECVGSRNWQTSVQECEQEIGYDTILLELNAEPGVKPGPQKNAEEKKSCSLVAVTEVSSLNDNSSHTSRGKNILRCDLCGYKTAVIQTFNKHLRDHLEGNSFHCWICGYQSDIKGNLMMEHRKHLKSGCPGRRDSQKPVEINCEQDIESDINVFKVETEPVIKSEPKEAEEQKKGFPVDVTGVSSLKDNTTAQTSLENTLVCDLCGFQTDVRPDFNNHLREHLLGKNLTCWVCGFRTDRKPNFIMHMRKHAQNNRGRLRKDKEERYFCVICGYQTYLMSNLIIHRKKHAHSEPSACDSSVNKVDNLALAQSKSILCCDICDFETDLRSTMKNHLNSHEKEKPFLCETCGFRTKQKGYLELHKWYRHTQHTQSAGNINGYKVNYSEVQYSEQTPAKKILCCDLCDFKTDLRSCLKNHLRSHEKVNSFLCEICGFRTDMMAVLVQHQRQQHAQPEPTTSDISCYKTKNSARAPAKIILCCDHCDYETFLISNLHDHLKTHQKEKALF